MPIIGEVFGASGDALDLTLVIVVVGATWSASRWIRSLERAADKRHANHDLRHVHHDMRIALLERHAGLDTKKSGAYPAIGDDE